MVREIHEQLTIEKDGHLEVHHADLTAGAKAEVTVRVTLGEAPTDDLSALWAAAAAITRSVPAEEWERVPADLSRNLDHYLYGGPKDAP
jgi:hypothetical protein